MIDTKICNWLMDNADAPIRYRVARELLKDEKAVQKIEPELLENPNVIKWMANLQPELPCHGCADNYLENAVPKLVQLGLHGGVEQVRDIIDNYIKNHIRTIENFCPSMPYRSNFGAILIASLISMTEVKDELIAEFMLNSLDEMYHFTKQGNYDIYISAEDKNKLTGVPQKWKNKNFIKPEILAEYGFGYPMIYDIIGLYRLYDLKNLEADKKIDNIINYISTDEFNHKISEGYGILIAGQYESGNMKYHGMGWDPKYPGWFNIADYMENVNAPKLLFFAQSILKYPPARKTKWFGDLLNYLEKYKTDSGTYIFPVKWLKESPGYAVQGHHVSFGESKRKKNWLEIESTFYVQLLQQNI